MIANAPWLENLETALVHLSRTSSRFVSKNCDSFATGWNPRESK